MRLAAMRCNCSTRACFSASACSMSLRSASAIFSRASLSIMPICSVRYGKETLSKVHMAVMAALICTCSRLSTCSLRFSLSASSFALRMSSCTAHHS